MRDSICLWVAIWFHLLEVFMKKAIGYEEIKKALFKELTKINASKKTAKKKEEAAINIGALAIDRLWLKMDNAKPDGRGDAQSKQSEGMIAATTHNRYVTRLRRDTTEKGFISYTFFDEIEAIKEGNPKHKEKLDKIDTGTHSTIDKSIRDIISKLSTSIKKSKRESTIKDLKNLIDSLSKLKTQNPVFISLIRRENEALDMRKREENRKVKYMKKQRKFSAVAALSMIYKLLASERWEDLAIGIALASGRRCSEVVHFGAFSKASEKETFSINFKGMRKSKGKQESTFKIPALVDAETLINAIERLRCSDRITALIKRLRALKLHDAELSRQLNSSLHSQLGERISDIFNKNEISKNADQKWIFKDTRALYARMSYATYRANAKKAGREGMLDTAYFKSVLLHTDLNETLSYMQFQLSDKDVFCAHTIKKTRTKGENLKFAERLPIFDNLLKSDQIASSRAFKKYCLWCISELKNNESIIFTARLLRKECGGRAEKIGEFVSILELNKINEKDLIIIEEKKKEKKKRITKVISLSVTVTYTKEIEIECDENEDINAIIEDELNFIGYSDFDERDITDQEYSIDSEEIK